MTLSSRRRHWPMARSTKSCDSLSHSVMIACFSWCRELSTLIDHSLKGPPKQHNRPDLSLGCLRATCQALSTLITQLVSVVADLSAMSDVSQVSVATYMRCCKIFSDTVTTNFLQILIVKEL